MKTRMQFWLFATALLVGAIPLIPMPGHAQTVVPGNHFLCHQMQDAPRPASFTNPENVQRSFDSEFGQDRNCRVRTQSHYFCSETAKTLVGGAADPRETPTGHFLCHSMACLDPVEIPDQVATDQFGTRRIRFFRERLTCAPACLGDPAECPE